MENTLLNKNSIYYNRRALLHILFLVLFYVIVDFYVINYSVDENAFSKGFYYKLLLCVLYLIGSKDEAYFTKSHNTIDAAFHFSVFYLCFWMGIASFLLESVSISRFIGIFILFGGLSAFNLIDEIIKIIRTNMGSLLAIQLVVQIILKVFLFSIFCFGLFFLTMGEWVWEVKPFYEW